jgi:hypothetical protein
MDGEAGRPSEDGTRRYRIRAAAVVVVVERIGDGGCSVLADGEEWRVAESAEETLRLLAAAEAEDAA